jgi:Gpi18-like mannosyltransferase
MMSAIQFFRAGDWLRASRWPRWFFRDVLTPFAATRILLVVVAWLGFHLVKTPLKSGKREVGSNDMVCPINGQLSQDTHPFVNMWFRWDSEWYLSIAKNGYQFTPGQESNVAFFPLYPYAVRLAHSVIPWRSDAGWLLIGILISNGSLLVALTYLNRLVRLDYDKATAARAVLYLCVFPTTLFLSAFYSESLFLAFVLSAFYYARCGRWLVAGLLAAAAAVGRPPGGLLIIALAFEYLDQKQFQWKQVRPDCLALLLAPAAVASHLAFFRWRFGEWDVLSRTEAVASWSRTLTLPWITLGTFFQRAHSGTDSHDSYLDFAFTIALLCLTTFAAFRLRLSYTVYAVVTVLFITSWGFLTSVPRYSVVIFPIMIALALLGRSNAFNRAYLTISGCIAAYCMFVFSHWGWVG